MEYLFILLGLTTLIQTDAYVLLQVRKQDNNQSKVDAFIHKMVPSNKFDEIAKKVARKQFDGYRTKSQNNNFNTEHKRETPVNFKMAEILQNALWKFAYEGIIPMFRSKTNIKPEIIHFRGEKPAVMYEVTSNAILNAMKEILSSKSLEKFVDKAAHEAAVVFRSIKDKPKHY